MTVLSCLNTRNYQLLKSLVPPYISLTNIPSFREDEFDRHQPDLIILGSDDWSKENLLHEEKVPYISKILLWGNRNDELELVLDMTQKGYSYLPYPYDNSQLNKILIVHRKESTGKEKDCFKDMGLIGESEALCNVKKTISQFAPSPESVNLFGETGTGKEICARALHKYSRRGGRFLAVNCAAIPETLLENELFGSVRGAYTDSISKQGYFEAADRGTLFLDEIGELPLTLQAKLLRVLEDRSITRLGCTHSRKVDVRIISATSSDLKSMIQRGEFRKDLYYRLNVLMIKLPALRDRRTDIPLLCSHFLKMDKSDKFFSNAALMKLLNYEWPGNIRELLSIIKRASILSEEGREIREEHILFY
ncbi:MAG: sigma-54 dependent transcriptional regulator [Spirochaetales bacterium]|nr:sigma-54 dependent transcriptional regulator [Spirochaetales bacterium]